VKLHVILRTLTHTHKHTHTHTWEALKDRTAKRCSILVAALEKAKDSMTTGSSRWTAEVCWCREENLCWVDAMCIARDLWSWDHKTSGI